MNTTELTNKEILALTYEEVQKSGALQKQNLFLQEELREISTNNNNLHQSILYSLDDIYSVNAQHFAYIKNQGFIKSYYYNVYTVFKSISKSQEINLHKYFTDVYLYPAKLRLKSLIIELEEIKDKKEVDEFVDMLDDYIYQVNKKASTYSGSDFHQLLQHQIDFNKVLKTHPGNSPRLEQVDAETVYNQMSDSNFIGVLLYILVPMIGAVWFLNSTNWLWYLGAVLGFISLFCFVIGFIPMVRYLRISSKNTKIKNAANAQNKDLSNQHEIALVSFNKSLKGFKTNVENHPLHRQYDMIATNYPDFRAIQNQIKQLNQQLQSKWR